MKPKSKEYFRDYQAVDVPDGKGGYRRALQYHGDLYSRALPERALRLQKMLFFAAALVCDAAFLLAISRNIESNRAGLLSVAGMILLFPLFFLSVGCLRNLWMKAQMTRNEYRGTTLFIRFGSLGCTVLALVNAVWQGYYISRHGLAQEQAGGIAAVTGFAVIALVAAAVCYYEWTTKYTIIRGDAGVVAPNRHENE